MFDTQIHNRRSIRLRGYDYAAAGLYFVTICVQHKEPLLGEIVDGLIVPCGAGRMVEHWWQKTSENFPAVELDHYILMPNHFHGIIILHPPRTVGADPRVCPDSKIDVCPDSKIDAGPDSKIDAGPDLGIDAGPDLGIDAGPGEMGGHMGPEKSGGHMGPPLPRVIQWFKTMTTNAYIHGVKQNHWPPFAGRFWQRNYYERISRNENELHNIRQYIQNNPQNWANDHENQP